MADFLQTNPQDPDAIRKAILAKMFGQQMPGSPPQTPGAPMATPQPQAAPTAPVAQPLSAGPQPQQPPQAKPLNVNSQAGDTSSQAPGMLSEADWAKQNPGPAHKPYVAPDLKHRVLMGLFSGLQQFGHDPGAGERMLGNYLGDIERKTQEEKDYPKTSAAEQHNRYLTYAQGQEQPLHLKEMQATIDERQAQAKERNAKAAAEANPQDFGHIAIKDPKDPANAKPALFNKKTGAILDPDTREAIPGAQLWEKPEPEKNLEKITVLGPDGKPHLYGVNPKGEKVQDFGVAPQQPRESRNDKTADVVERETRTAVRKAQESYRGAQATSDMQREFIKEAKGGNKAAVKIVPLEGALEITTSQGVHRINRTEVEQYGGAGSLWDRIMGKIGHGLTGKDIPDNVLDDMDKMTQEVEKNAYQRYSDSYDDEVGIAHGYGVDVSKHLPKLSHGARGAGDAGAKPPGWK